MSLIKISFKNKIAIYRLILLLSTVFLLYFIFVGYRLHNFNSDAAIRVLFAKEVFDSRNLFPPNWVFVNGDIAGLSPHLFVIPLLYILPVGFTVFAIAGFVSIIFIFLALKLILNLCNINKFKKTEIYCVFAGGISLPLSEHFIGQISYGTSFFFSSILIWTSWNILNVLKHNIFFYKIIFSFIMVSIVWMNPERAIFYQIAPLFASLMIYDELRVDKVSNKRNCKNKSRNLLIIFFICIILGLIFRWITLPKLHMERGYTSLIWLNIEGIINRLGKILGGILFILGGEPLSGRSVMSVVGAYEAIRIIGALLLLMVVPFSIANIIKRGNQFQLYLLTYSSVSFLLIFFVLLTTNLYDERYLIPSILFFVMIVGIQSFDRKKNPILFISKIIIIIVLISNSLVLSTNYWKSYNVITAKRVNYPIYGSIEELKDFLISKELKNGYATYWRSGLLTVLSDEKLKIRTIDISNGIPKPSAWIGSLNWYKSADSSERIFLLLTPEEDASVNWIEMANLGFTPSIEYQFHDYKIYVFERNFTNGLKGW